jgi:hypothetical protein
MERALKPPKSNDESILIVAATGLAVVIPGDAPYESERFDGISISAASNIENPETRSLRSRTLG